MCIRDRQCAEHPREHRQVDRPPVRPPRLRHLAGRCVGPLGVCGQRGGGLHHGGTLWSRRLGVSHRSGAAGVFPCCRLLNDGVSPALRPLYGSVRGDQTGDEQPQVDALNLSVPNRHRLFLRAACLSSRPHLSLTSSPCSRIVSVQWRGTPYSIPTTDSLF